MVPQHTRHLLPFFWGLPPKLPPHDSRCCCFQAEPGTRKYRAVRVAPCFPHNPCATCGRSCGFTDRELDVERHPCGLGCGCRFGTRARAPRASHTRLVPPPTILKADNPSPRRMIRESPPPAVCWGCKYVNPPECERLMCEDLVPEDTVATSASSAARAFVASGSAVLATLGKRVEDARRDRTARHARQDQGFQGAALNPQSAPPQPPTTTTTFAVGTAAPIEPPEIPPLAFPSTEPPATLAPAYPAPPFARAAEVPRPPPPPTTTTAATTIHPRRAIAREGGAGGELGVFLSSDGGEGGRRGGESRGDGGEGGEGDGREDGDGAREGVAGCREATGTGGRVKSACRGRGGEQTVARNF